MRKWWCVVGLWVNTAGCGPDGDQVGTTGVSDAVTSATDQVPLTSAEHVTSGPLTGTTSSVTTAAASEPATTTAFSPNTSPTAAQSQETAVSTDSTGALRNYPSLPIPVAFVGMTDEANGIIEFAGPEDFDDCPHGLVSETVGTIAKDTVIWSDCVAERITAELNRAFQELLDTDQVFFSSQGYSTTDAPEYALFNTREEVEVVLEELGQRFGQPGLLVGVVSNWVEQGGYAPTDMPLDDEFGVVFALSQGAWHTAVHEVGHVVGLLHTDEDPDDVGVLRYEVCGEISAPILADCNCEYNYMEAFFGPGRCPQCVEKPYSFVTPTHGEYFRQVSDCWFAERRFLGQNIWCELPEVARCEGFENEPLDCLCADGETQVTFDGCSDEGTEDAAALYEKCGIDFGVEPTVDCSNYAGYPGVDCYADAEAQNSECYCRDGNSVFTVTSACDALSAEQIYEGCLPGTVGETCVGSSAQDSVTCVSVEGLGLSCICRESGAIFTYAVGVTCMEVDLDDASSSCSAPF